jgi:hypothetical protein
LHVLFISYISCCLLSYMFYVWWLKYLVLLPYEFIDYYGSSFFWFPFKSHLRFLSRLFDTAGKHNRWSKLLSCPSVAARKQLLLIILESSGILYPNRSHTHPGLQSSLITYQVHSFQQVILFLCTWIFKFWKCWWRLFKSYFKD